MCRILDREWALHLMESAVADLSREWADAGKQNRFTALRPYLPGASVPIDVEDIMQRTGLSDTGLRTEISRMRKRLREIIRTRVAATVDSPAEVDAELAHLHRVLSVS